MGGPLLNLSVPLSSNDEDLAEGYVNDPARKALRLHGLGNGCHAAHSFIKTFRLDNLSSSSLERPNESLLLYYLQY